MEIAASFLTTRTLPRKTAAFLHKYAVHDCSFINLVKVLQASSVAVVARRRNAPRCTTQRLAMAPQIVPDTELTWSQTFASGTCRAHRVCYYTGGRSRYYSRIGPVHSFAVPILTCRLERGVNVGGDAAVRGMILGDTIMLVHSKHLSLFRADRASFLFWTSPRTFIEPCLLYAEPQQLPLGIRDHASTTVYR